MFFGLPEVQAIFATFFNQEQHTRSFASVFQGRMLLKTSQIVYAVPTCKVQNFVIWDLSHGNVSWAQFELQW